MFLWFGGVFASYDRLEFHLAPPAFSRRNAKGELLKRSFGPWMIKAFGLLAKLKNLRGTMFDVFGYGAERRMERGLIAAYENDLAFAAAGLTTENFAEVTALLALPMEIRGFGHVKHTNFEKAKAEHGQLVERIRAPKPEFAIAAE